jgi:2,3-bisphosphoglycerate-dependent phosphoglycerate mutase
MSPASDDRTPTRIPKPTLPSAAHAAPDPPAPTPPESPLDLAFLTNLAGVGRLILVRHGQQRWPEGPNPAASEWVDPPLSETGRRQAEIVGAALAGEPVDAVYCSHLERAHQTGRQIGQPHGLEPVVLNELREIEIFRDLPHGKSVRDMVSEPVLRGMRERFVQERSWDVYPYSESSAELRLRVITVIEGIAAMHAGATVVVACHGGVINAYIGHVLGIAQDMFFRPGHASVSRVLAGDGRRVVHSLNEFHHLAEVDPGLVTF